MLQTEPLNNYSRKTTKYNWKLVGIGKAIVPKPSVWDSSFQIISETNDVLSSTEKELPPCSCPYGRERARCNMAFWPLDDDL